MSPSSSKTKIKKANADEVEEEKKEKNTSKSKAKTSSKTKAPPKVKSKQKAKAVRKPKKAIKEEVKVLPVEKARKKKKKPSKARPPYVGPTEVFAECYVCNRETLHEVITGKMFEKKEMFVGVIKCTECGTTRKETIKEQKPVSVRMIVSEEGTSKKAEIRLMPNEEVKVGDELDFDGGIVLVTSVETARGRIEKAPAKDIVTIWTKRYNQVKVKLAVNRGDVTHSLYSYSAPSDEYTVGEELDINNAKIVIHAIKTTDKLLQRGSAQARDIVRIYGKEVTPEGSRKARFAARRREMVEKKRAARREKSARMKAEKKARYEEARKRTIAERRARRRM